MKREQLTRMTIAAIFIALIAVMTFTPYVGYISLPGIGLSITTLAVPVIVGAILLGPLYGTVLGAAWGVTCLLYAVAQGTFDAAIFLNPLISVLPRILVGSISGYIYVLLRKAIKNKIVPILITSAVTSLSNTILVITAINLFHSDELFTLGKTLKDIITIAISLNGVVELAIALIIPLPVILVLQKLLKLRTPPMLGV